MTTGKIVELLDTHKAKAAFLAPLVTALLAAAGSYVITGNWNDTEIRTAVSGALLGLASAFATYFTPAGVATVDATPPGPKPGSAFIQDERGEISRDLILGILIAAVAVLLIVVFV